MTDLLLNWMSFRGAGRTDDLPADLADGAAARRVVDDFALLGHLEPVNGAAWRIVPPVLAGLPGEAGENPGAVLCGARTAGVLAGVSAACQSAGAQMTLSPRMPGATTTLGPPFLLF